MSSNSASVKRRVSNTRCGETTELNRVTGRFSGRNSISLASATAAGAKWVTTFNKSRTRRSGAVAVCSRPWPASDSSPGAESANQGSGGPSGSGWALRSSSIAVSSLSWFNSTAARWVLSSNAKLPGERSRKPSRPSIT